MRKLHLSAVLVLALNLSLSAAFYNVKDYGATGDGHSIDSPAINQAIEAAAQAGGGTVFFPAGTYLSYSIRLRDHIGLHLDHGSVILAAEPTEDQGYDAAEPNPWGDLRYQDFGHSHWHDSLIWGENLEDISITGPGLIHGKGLRRWDTRKPGDGNKAIALKLCRNVIMRDFSILFGGHFGILATGLDNWTVDNLKIDTNRDGINVDCCRHVRISNCSINAPFDDALVLKSSYGLGFARATENVTITNCQVSGFDRGTFLDGTYQRNEMIAPDQDPVTGRIKFGTESNGGFKNITISNCIFDRCRGMALETVDGGYLEDVTISNITMRDITNSPIFLRLGSRMRGPEGVPVGKLRRIKISDVIVTNADPEHASIISGVPGHPIEDVQLNNVRIDYQGGGKAEQAQIKVPENEGRYPEPSMFGPIPAYGFFLRHVKGLEMNHVQLRFEIEDRRPAFILEDVANAEFNHIKTDTADNVPTFKLQDVTDFKAYQCNSLPETTLKKVSQESL